MQALLGIISGLTVIMADAPYIRDILRGTTQPHRISWLVFCIVNAINFANQLASGATSSLWLFAAGAFITLIIFLLSVTRGVGGFAKLDIFVLLATALGLLLWAVLNTPIASILCNTAIILVSLAPTIKKAYLHPASETKITWAFGALSNLLGMLAVSSLNYRLLLLPLAALLGQITVWLILILKGPLGRPVNGTP